MEFKRALLRLYLFCGWEVERDAEWNRVKVLWEVENAVELGKDAGHKLLVSGGGVAIEEDGAGAKARRVTKDDVIALAKLHQIVCL